MDMPMDTTPTMISSTTFSAKRFLVLAVLALAMGLASSETAFARGGARIHFGVTLGAPLYWYGAYPAPYYYSPYYSPYYYYPPSVIVASPPPAPVYVERERIEQAPARQDSSGSWYFCRDENAYYPYVKQCPGGWERVSPQAPAS